MLYVFMFCGIVLLSIGAMLLLQGRSKEEKAALERLDTLMETDAPATAEDSILIELDTRKNWLEQIIGGTSMVHGIETLLNQAAWSISAEIFLLWCLGAGFFGFVVAWLFFSSIFAEIALFAAGALLPYMYLRYSRTKRLKAFDKALPDAMDIMQRTLKAGLSLNDAFKRTSEKAKEPVASEFHTVVVRMQRGADMKSELINLAERVPTADNRIFITALNVQKETGGDLPIVLERLTEMIRVRMSLLGEMKAETAQGRMSGMFLAGLPVLMGVALKIINPDYMAPLFHDPRGRYMLIYCVVSNLLGLFFIRRITSLEV